MWGVAEPRAAEATSGNHDAALIYAEPEYAHASRSTRGSARLVTRMVKEEGTEQKLKYGLAL